MSFEIVNTGTKKYTEVLANSALSHNCSPNFAVRDVTNGHILAEVNFQDGPIKEVGVNGVANEDLIAMVMHRLNQFQSSNFACEENEDAYTHLGSALASLRKRTNKRSKRGVEGTSEV